MFYHRFKGFQNDFLAENVVFWQNDPINDPVIPCKRGQKSKKDEKGREGSYLKQKVGQ